ncbi:MAG: hypothetical protein KatS3mg020_1094 [Fimbriimonadales bacterium]|nr:MAG: hypothetical protein KatS3mg020_1094 [Fimbriimonadales bacterium]
MNGTGYVIPQVGCSVCGAGCEPLQERCTHCGADPFEGVGERLGPLGVRRFWLGLGWRALIGLPLLVWFFGNEWERLPNWSSLPGWAQLVVGTLGAIAAITFLRQMWLMWQAAQVALVVTPEEAWLLRRTGGRVYLERMNWLECLPPEASRGWQLLEMVGALVRLITHVGLQAIAILLPDHEVYEMRMCSRFDQRRVWRLALVGAHYHPRFALTTLAQYALPHWLQSGVVRIEPGYEPSAERPFLALDLSTRTLQAYAFREVRLEEGDLRVNLAHESHNPDGSLVENDHSLQPDAAAAGQAEQRHLKQLTLPAYAVPYGDYWLRADWGIIKRIEKRRAVSETATPPPPLAIPNPQGR